MIADIKALRDYYNNLYWFQRWFFPRNLAAALTSNSVCQSVVYSAFFDSWSISHWFFSGLRLFASTPSTKKYRFLFESSSIKHEHREAILNCMENNPVIDLNLVGRISETFQEQPYFNELIDIVTKSANPYVMSNFFFQLNLNQFFEEDELRTWTLKFLRKKAPENLQSLVDVLIKYKKLGLLDQHTGWREDILDILVNTQDQHVANTGIIHTVIFTLLEGGVTRDSFPHIVKALSQSREVLITDGEELVNIYKAGLLIPSMAAAIIADCTNVWLAIEILQDCGIYNELTKQGLLNAIRHEQKPFGFASAMKIFATHAFSFDAMTMQKIVTTLSQIRYPIMAVCTLKVIQEAGLLDDSNNLNNIDEFCTHMNILCNAKNLISVQCMEPAKFTQEFFDELMAICGEEISDEARQQRVALKLQEVRQSVDAFGDAPQALLADTGHHRHFAAASSKLVPALELELLKSKPSNVVH